MAYGDEYSLAGWDNGVEYRGLTKVGGLYDDGAWPGFDMLLVFQDPASGRYFWAQDSGCSCPAPFEDYYFKDADDNDLAELTRATLPELERDIRDFAQYGPPLFEERLALLKLVRGLV